MASAAKAEAVVVIDPEIVQQGRKQQDMAILSEQGFSIVKQKTFQMSPNQAKRFCGGDEVIASRFSAGPICALIVTRSDDRSPYESLREINLETVFFTKTPYEALRAKMALFPEQKQFERTFAVATGDKALAALEEIITRESYIIVWREERALSSSEAAVLHVQLSFEQKTLFVLDKVGAVNDLQLAAGPPPTPIAASSSVADALKAIRLLWPEGFPVIRTLGLIKPDAVRRGDHIAILQLIIESGFTIVAEKLLQLTVERAKEFYEEHHGRPFFDGLVEFMASGPLVALALSRPNAVSAWRTVLGPTNSNTARELAPTSFRALYGTDGQKNACHGSSSSTAAARELAFFFPELPPDNPNITKEAISSFLTDKPDFRRQHEVSLNEILIRALTHLCRTKPVGLNAIAELGYWLRDNNPRKPKVIAPSQTCEQNKTDSGTILDKLRSRSLSNYVRIVFMLGGPGSGKHTQCDLMKRHLGYCHISTDDLLRAEIDAKTIKGRAIEETLQQGKLLKDEIVLDLILEHMLRSGASTFLIDGFPRRLDQAFKFEEHIAPCDFVLFLDVPDQTLIERRARGSSAAEEEQARNQARSQIACLHQEQLPVVHHYEQFEKVRKVDAAGTPDQVYDRIRRIVAASDPNAKRPKTTLERLEADAMGSKITVVFVLGGPGSGKGTQCDLMKSQLGFFHISSGDLLRAEIANKTPLGLSLQETIVQGKLVDDNVILTMIENAMLKSGANKFLIDGFPRRLDQAFKFEKRIARCDIVLYFQAPDQVLIDRLLERGKSSGRSDDNIETIQKRLHTFHEESLPAVEHYRLFDRVRMVDAVRPKDQVFDDVKRIMAKEISV